MSKKTIPMSDHEYALNEGGKCPWCRSENLDYDLRDSTEEGQRVTCQSCGKRWEEISDVSRYIELGDDNDEVETKGKPAAGTKFYLVTVSGCIEPQSPQGPYPTEEDRNNAAKFIHTELNENDAGPFWLDVSDKGVPNMGAYSGRFFQEG